MLCVYWVIRSSREFPTPIERRDNARPEGLRIHNTTEVGLRLIFSDGELAYYQIVIRNEEEHIVTSFLIAPGTQGKTDAHAHLSDLGDALISQDPFRLGRTFEHCLREQMTRRLREREDGSYGP
jgi:hypothetical protein